MLQMFSVRVAEKPNVWERAVYMFPVRVFREPLSIRVCALSLLVLRVGCGI